MEIKTGQKQGIKRRFNLKIILKNRGSNMSGKPGKTESAHEEEHEKHVEEGHGSEEQQPPASKGFFRNLLDTYKPKGVWEQVVFACTVVAAVGAAILN